MAVRGTKRNRSAEDKKVAIVDQLFESVGDFDIQDTFIFQFDKVVLKEDVLPNIQVRKYNSVTLRIDTSELDFFVGDTDEPDFKVFLKVEPLIVIKEDFDAPPVKAIRVEDSKEEDVIEEIIVVDDE